MMRGKKNWGVSETHQQNKSRESEKHKETSILLKINAVVCVCVKWEQYIKRGAFEIDPASYPPPGYDPLPYIYNNQEPPFGRNYYFTFIDISSSPFSAVRVCDTLNLAIEQTETTVLSLLSSCWSVFLSMSTFSSHFFTHTLTHLTKASAEQPVCAYASVYDEVIARAHHQAREDADMDIDRHTYSGLLHKSWRNVVRWVWEWVNVGVGVYEDVALFCETCVGVYRDLTNREEDYDMWCEEAGGLMVLGRLPGHTHAHTQEC